MPLTIMPMELIEAQIVAKGVHFHIIRASFRVKITVIEKRNFEFEF